MTRAGTGVRAAVAAAVFGATACGDSGPPVPNVTFDGAKALSYVAKQVEFGPRVPGSAAHRAAGDWIVQTLRPLADTVIEQTWTHTTKDNTALPMRNIFARFNVGAAQRILYVTHWDSRPLADKGATVAERAAPVPGANDGALLFTDGEDYGDFGPPEVDVLIGSTYYADHILPDSSYRPTFGVLWDMIGDRSLRFLREPYSMDYAPEIVDRVWDLAARMGYERVFDQASTTTIMDDHVPLGKKGFRIIDVIDLEFPWHHTGFDTIDKVSAESLEIVGRVALALIRQIE
jgi:hypothetical protein